MVLRSISRNLQNLFNIYSDKILEANSYKVYQFEFTVGPSSPVFAHPLKKKKSSSAHPNTAKK